MSTPSNTNTLNSDHDAGSKVSRNAAIQSKPNKILWNSDKSPNQKSKQDKLLEPIAKVLASQPSSMRAALEEIAIKVLHAALQLRRCKARVNSTQRNPDYICRSADWKFKLTCAKEYAEDAKFKQLVVHSAEIVKIARRSVQKDINAVQEIELDGAANKLQSEFFICAQKFFRLHCVYVRAQDPKLRNLQIPLSPPDLYWS